MSKLGSLFGMSSKDDSSDSLKYSAPKEPRKNSSSSSSSSSSAAPSSPAPAASAPTPVAATSSTTTTTTAAAAVAPTQSKVLASATVRLYKMNASTRQFEAHENGSPLGCILMGMGLTYQLFIYNGQRVPQVVIPISPKWQYSLQNMYVSFTDPANGNAWSILFDNVEVLCNFQRILMSIQAHIASHFDSISNPSGQLSSDISPSSGYIKAVLATSTTTTSTPFADLSKSTDASNVPIVQSNATVGIYYSIYEVGELSAYPDEHISNTGNGNNASLAVYRHEAPNEVAKIK